MLEKTLERSLDGKEIKPVNPEGNHPGIFTGKTLKRQYFGHLMKRANSLEKTMMLRKIEGKKKGATEDELVGWHHRLNGHEFEHTLADSERREAWCAAVHHRVGLTNQHCQPLKPP